MLVLFSNVFVDFRGEQYACFPWKILPYHGGLCWSFWDDFGSIFSFLSYFLSEVEFFAFFDS